MDVMQAVVGDQQWSLVRYDSGYWVELHEPQKFTRWGPIDSYEQAMQVSGFPKTEVEELWELVEELRAMIFEFHGFYLPHHAKDRAVKRIDEMRDKWKK